MRPRRSDEPAPSPPTRASKRLSIAVTSLKTARTRIETTLRTTAVDDIGHTDDGKRLHKELWVLSQKLHGVTLWLARIRADYARGEVALRDQKKLKALGVDPTEVLNRGVH